MLISLNLAPRPEMAVISPNQRVVNRKEGDEKGTSDGTQISELRNLIGHLAPHGQWRGSAFRQAH
jgi:hypothetical protein